MPNSRLLILALALAVSACTSSETMRPSQPRDPLSLYRPSNSSVLFPGEHRSKSIDDLPGLWLLQ